MLINADALIPLLSAAKQAKAELQESDAKFQALSKRDQLAQVDDFLAKDDLSQKAYEEASQKIMVALEEAISDAQVGGK